AAARLSGVPGPVSSANPGAVAAAFVPVEDSNCRYCSGAKKADDRRTAWHCPDSRDHCPGGSNSLADSNWQAGSDCPDSHLPGDWNCPHSCWAADCKSADSPG